MARLLFVRSGNVSNPITGSFSPPMVYLSKIVGNHGLQYLGKELPELGQSTRVKSPRDPQHVVLKLSAAEAVLLGWSKEGLYRVAGLPPNSVDMQKR